MKRPAGEAEAALVSAVERLLQSHLPQEITTTMVLRAANVARGTLYRHFEDLDALIEKSLVAAFRHSVELNISLLLNAIDSARSTEELLLGFEKILEASQSRSLKGFRFLRARLIAYSEGNERLRGVLALEQDRLTSKFEALLRRLMDKGWFREDLDLRVTSVFIQAFTLGKVIDDFTPVPMNEAAWNRLMMQIIRNVLMMPRR